MAKMHKDMAKAISYFRSGTLKEAEHLFKNILRRFPRSMQALHYLIQISLRNNDYDSLIAYLTKAIELEPTNPEHHNNLGVLLKSTGRIDEAIEHFKKAIHCDRRFVNAHYNLGNAFKIKGCFDDAATCYQTVLQIAPHDYEAWNNLGNVFQEQERLEEALACYEKAIHVYPEFALAYSNMGAIFQGQGLFEKAYQCYDMALKIDPRLTSAINNMGVAHREEGRLDKAHTYFRNAMKIDPSDPESYWNEAITYLLEGRLMEGWQLYEWRFRKKDCPVIDRKFSNLRWTGASIQDKTILLCAEQGLGDTVQFIRYAPLIAEKGAKVVVECQKELVSLVQTVKGIGEVIEKNKELPAFDEWCPLLSLPMIFETTLETVPANVPYFEVHPEKKTQWKQRLFHDPAGFRVGLAWAGNPKYRHDRIRSCPFELFARLKEVEGVVLYSLQKDVANKPHQVLSGGAIIIDYMEEVRDFSDTAALIDNLDLVISVDTAVAHVAGALGKKVWTLLRYSPDWRWMLHRRDSPWYPTMKLFRQPKFGDWESVIDEVLCELRHYVSLWRKSYG